MSRYDGKGKPVPVLTVFLSTALKGLVNNRQLNATEIKILEESIEHDLQEALIGWDALIDASEPPIQSILFA